MLKLFSQLRSFTEIFGELKNLNSANGNFENRAVQLRTDWSSFRERLEMQIEEQDTFDKLTIFIKSVQKNLTSFSNKIFGLFKAYEATGNASLFKVQEQLSEICDETIEVLDFIQKKYPEYFEPNTDIPLWKIYTNKQAYCQSKQIISNFQQRNIDIRLIEIIAEYLRILYDSSNSKIKDWYQFMYMEALANELCTLAQTSKDSNDTLKLIKMLIGYDFNPLVFYEFMLEYSAGVAGQDMPYEDQEMELLGLLKIIENIRPECKSGFNTEVPSICQSVGGSIRRELKIIERKKLVYSANFQNSKKSNVSNFYFEVSTTLEELFFLNRVMLEVRFIKTKFKSNFYAFIGRHIRTARTDTPSPQYMRNIFGPNKEVPTRVVKKIRLWLVMMLNFIDTNFKDQVKVWQLGFITISFQEDLIGLCLLAI